MQRIRHASSGADRDVEPAQLTRPSFGFGIGYNGHIGDILRALQQAILKLRQKACIARIKCLLLLRKDDLLAGSLGFLLALACVLPPPLLLDPLRFFHRKFELRSRTNRLGQMSHTAW